MKRRKIVTTFTDQGSEQYKNKGQGPGFFPKRSTQDSRVGFTKSNPHAKVKVFGDTNASTFSTHSNLNLKNDYEKRVLAVTASKQDVQESFNSSVDNTHYFDGAKKFVDLKLNFFSGIFFTPDQVANSFQLIDSYGTQVTNGAMCATFDSRTGDLYVGGVERITGTNTRPLLRKRSRGSTTFTSIDSYNPSTAAGNHRMTAVTVSPIDGTVYWFGHVIEASSDNGIVRRSTSGASGSFSTAFETRGQGNLGFMGTGGCVSPIDGAVYFVGRERTDVGAVLDSNFAVYKSTDGLSYSVVDCSVTGATLSSQANVVAVSPVDGAIYVGGTQQSVQSILRRSTTGASGTFTTVDSTGSAGSEYDLGYRYIAFSTFDGSVYVSNGSIIRRSTTGASGTFSTVASAGDYSDLYVSPLDGSVWAFGANTVTKSASGLSGTFSSTIVNTNVAGGSFSGQNGGLISISGGKLLLFGSNTSGIAWTVYESSNVLFNSGTQYSLNGSSAQLRRDLYDQNNVLLIDGIDYYSSQYNPGSIFGYSNVSLHNLLYPVLYISISGVNESFNSTNINIKFKDIGSGSFDDITLKGTFFSSSQAGWVNYIYNFDISGSVSFPSMSYISPNVSLLISSSAGKNYSFKDAKILFKEALANDGVVYYRNIDNQNNKNIFEFIKAGIGVKII
jgi:hypothetical protein